MDAFAVKEFLKDDSISHYITIYHNRRFPCSYIYFIIEVK